MQNPAVVLSLIAVMAMPAAAEARSVTLQTTLANYGGKGAYLAIYLTDPQGKIHSTLHVAAPKAKYHQHLRHWSRAPAGARRTVDGVTGASVGSGRSLKVRVDVADALIDAGYQIRVDSAVEDGRDNPSEVVAVLAKGTVGVPVAGKGYVKSFRFDL